MNTTMTEKECYLQNLAVLSTLAELVSDVLVDIAGNDMAAGIGDDPLTKATAANFAAARLNNTVLAG